MSDDPRQDAYRYRQALAAWLRDIANEQATVARKHWTPEQSAVFDQIALWGASVLWAGKTYEYDVAEYVECIADIRARQQTAIGPMGRWAELDQKRASISTMRWLEDALIAHGLE